ncbi:hypothetical protein BC831DRAFT_246629 [Entophlyctis helioformis]|nr:hypothetical protein BC831DRAFT_246629 [Entophlyctis helioformis]
MPSATTATVFQLLPCPVSAISMPVCYDTITTAPSRLYSRLSPSSFVYTHRLCTFTTAAFLAAGRVAALSIFRESRFQQSIFAGLVPLTLTEHTWSAILAGLVPLLGRSTSGWPKDVVVFWTRLAAEWTVTVKIYTLFFYRVVALFWSTPAGSMEIDSWSRLWKRLRTRLDWLLEGSRCAHTQYDDNDDDGMMSGYSVWCIWSCALGYSRGKMSRVDGLCTLSRKPLRINCFLRLGPDVWLIRLCIAKEERQTGRQLDG